MTEGQQAEEPGAGPRLIDGSEPCTPERLLARLDELGISSTTMTHPPVFTVEEAKEKRGHIDGAHTKNLFLRDKKARMWLVVCLEDRRVDLRWLAQQVGCKRLSFGSDRRLMHYLGVIPGAVNPFSVINDHTSSVAVVLDREILERDPLNFHPLDNGMTTSISAQGFLTFLDAVGHPPALIDFTEQQDTDKP